MKVTKDLSGGKMNKDRNERYLDKGDYRDLINGRVISSEGSDEGILEKIKGTMKLNVPSIRDDWNVIGFSYDNGYLYYVATGLIHGEADYDGNGTIIGRYKINTGFHQIILEDTQSATRDIILKLDKNTRIARIIVFRGMLIFCDKKNNPPYKINIEQSIEDFDFYENTNQIMLAKEPPFSEPEITGIVDDTIDTNYFKGEPFQFAYRYIYEDQEISAISMYSGSPVEIEEIGDIIDGRIGYIVTKYQERFAVYRTDSRFQTSLSRKLFTTTSESGWTDSRDRTMVSVSSSVDGSRVVALSEGLAIVLDYTSPSLPNIIKKFVSNDFDIGSGGQSWEGCVISRNGENILLSLYDDDTEDEVVYKMTTPISSSSTLELVHTIESPYDQGFASQRMCASADTDVVFCGYGHTIARSKAFGSNGSWSNIVDLSEVAEVAQNAIRVVAMCCSSDGKTVYATCGNLNDGSPTTYIVRSRDSGDNWDLIFRSDTSKQVTCIDCSSDGRIIASGTVIGSGSESILYVSTNGGISFGNVAIGEGVPPITGVTVSTTGKHITAVANSGGTTGSASVFQSNDFGETWVRRILSSVTTGFAQQIGISSINRETTPKSLNRIDNLVNRIDVTVQTGDKHVKEVEIMLRTPKTDRLYKIATLNKEADGIADDSTHTISFFNDGSYTSVPSRDKNKMYDNVPHKAQVMNVVQNALLIANYEDGNSLTDSSGNPISVDMSVDILASSFSPGTNVGLKTQSVNTYGIEYFDDFNRYTNILVGPTVNIESLLSNPANPIKKARLEIRHLAPNWATKYKIVRKEPILDYDIINGFDNAYLVGSEVFLEITSNTGVVPRENDTLDLVSEINTGASEDAYRVAPVKLTVPILRYVDSSDTGQTDVSLELSDGTTTTRVDSQSSEGGEPVPKGRYIVINVPTVDGYTSSEISGQTTKFLNSLFYIIKNRNIEDQKLYREIPGTFRILPGGYHEGNLTNQSNVNPAVVSLDNDYDVVWGISPIREMYKYELTTNITNLGRPHIVSDNFRRVDRIASLIASEQYVDDTNFNGLSSFNLSLIPYKDLDVRDGEIELIDSEDTNVEVYQKNKLSRVLYRKNVLTTAAGAQAVTQTEDIWGEQIRSTTEYGLTHEQSFASWGNNRYFVDAERGVVIRKGADGPTEISSYGMLDYFYDLLRANKDSKIVGVYEPKHKIYTLTIDDSETISFNERTNGWELRNNTYPTNAVNNGTDVFFEFEREFYMSEAGQSYNNFFGIQYSMIADFFINNAIDVVKSFNALSINGDIPNKVELFTESDSVEIPMSFFETIEGLHYAAIPTSSNIDNYEYNFAGMVMEDVTSSIIPVKNDNNTRVHVGDLIFKNGNTLVNLGICTEVGHSYIILDSPTTLIGGDILLSVDNSTVNGNHLKGRILNVKLTYDGPDQANFNSITVEYDESKQ